VSTLLTAMIAFLMEIGLEQAPENFAYTVLKFSAAMIVAIVMIFMVQHYRLANWAIFIPIGIVGVISLWLTTLTLEEWRNIAKEAVEVLFGLES